MFPKCRNGAFLAVLAYSCVLAFAQDTNAEEWITWEIADGGNGHEYALTVTELTWPEAEDLAISLGGHLVSILDQEENDWLLDTWPLDPFDNLWIGFQKVMHRSHRSAICRGLDAARTGPLAQFSVCAATTSPSSN